MKLTFTCFLTLLTAASVFGQSRYAQSSGTWTTITWTSDQAGAVPAVAPTGSDNVFTNGQDIIVNGNVSCRNLYVTYDNAAGITIQSGRILTINGTLTGWDDGNDWDEMPQPGVIVFSAVTSRLNFTGSSIDVDYSPYVIYFWDDTAPLGRVTLPLSGSRSFLNQMAFTDNITVSSGTLALEAPIAYSGVATPTLTVSTGATLAAGAHTISYPAITVAGTLTSSVAISGAGDLTVASGGVLNVTGTVSKTNITVDGSFTTSNTVTATTNFTVNSTGQVSSSGAITAANTSIAGTVTTSNFLNTSGNFTLTGTLNSSFNGVTQTTGWWSNNNSPGGSISLSATSTVNFSGASAQNIPSSISFGNLTLSGAGAKTLVGSSALNVAGNLAVDASFNSNSTSSILVSGGLSNSTAWTIGASTLFTFSGGADQSVTGTGAITFGGGLDVNKSGGTVTINRPSISVSNGFSLISGTFNLSSRTLNLLSGNFDNGAIFTSATSTVAISGTSVVEGSTTTTFNNLTVNNGASLTTNNNMVVNGTLTNSGTLIVPSTNNLFVNGNFANTGTFTPNNSTLIFDGSATQTLSGTLSVTNMTINNAVDNNAALSLGGLLTLDGVSDFNANGSGSGTLTVRSTSLTAGGRIGALPAPEDFTGTVTVERFVNSPENYRYLAFPVENPNLGMWKSDNAVNGIPITGNFSNPTPAGPAAGAKAEIFDASAASVFYFDGATQAYVAVANPGNTVSAANAQVTNTRGYVAWTFLNANTTLRTTGTINKGAIGIPLSSSGSGWNLVPNPYPSPIDIDNVNTTNTTNTIYFTTGQGQFATYLKGSGTCTGCSFNTNWRGEVSTGQSFWIQSTGSTSLAMTETAKTTGSSNFVREKTLENYLRVTLSASDKEDDLIIRFEEGASKDLEYDLDAAKKKNEAFINLSSYNADPNVSFAINTLPYINCQESIKLKVEDVTAGEHSLRFTEMESITLGYVLTLVDHFTQTETPITEDAYNFTVTSDPLSFGANRFEIKVASPLVDVNRELTLTSTQECSDAFVKVQLANLQTGVRYLLKLDDEALHTPVVGDNGTASTFIPKSALALGVNNLALVATTVDGCNAHMFNNALAVNLYEINEVATVTGAQSCGEGSVVLSASGALSNGSYRWYESENAIDPIEGVTGSSFTTPDLTASATYYVSVVNPAGCESLLRKPVQATIVSLAAPELSVNGYVIQASGVGDFQWFKDGEAIEGATGTSYEARTTGTYTVSVTLDGCTSTSEGIDFLITDAENPDDNSGYSIYPNPGEGLFRISGPMSQNQQMTIYDRQGRKVAGSEVVTDVNSNGAVVDITKSRKGVYLINIQEKNKVILLKAIKK